MPAESAKTVLWDGKSQPRRVDVVVATLAEAQHGVVGRWQLLERGLREGEIEGRLRRSLLHRLHAGVYAVGHRAITQQGRWMAAVLACGPGAALSHRSAAALWGIRAATGVIDVTLPSKSRSSRPIRRHCSSLPPDEVIVEDGIPVTTVPRTLFDLAATASADEVEAALRQSEFLRLHDRLSLPHLLERYPGRRGTRIVRECLERRRELPAGETRSWLEERFLPFLRRHGLPRPRLNAWIEVGGRSLQIDCLWPVQSAIVELDGFAAHGTRAAFREDRVRDRRLRVAGYGVTRVASEQLDGEPEALAADLRALLGVG
jgi:very-short-patch-repair endonuclease